MPAVFVHGNPETTAVWEPLLAELAAARSDLICLSPPGFGAPLPAGFGATQADYRDWLVEELTALGEPVDLVGHDWGGGHVVNVVLSRPDLVRSWVSDVLGIYDPGYRWHELARLWQTPDVGEADVVARSAVRPRSVRGCWRSGEWVGKSRLASRPGRTLRWAERSSRCTARPPIRALSGSGWTWSARRRVQVWRSWPQQTRPSAPKRNVDELPAVRGRKWWFSKAWATGG